MVTEEHSDLIVPSPGARRGAFRDSAVACVAGTGGYREDVTAGATSRVTHLEASDEILNISSTFDCVFFERETGLGPATLGLGSRCSTS